MEKKEFLEKLNMSLAGQVPRHVIAENIQYYDNYITEEMAKGKDVAQILDGLGDPRLIARSIIDANGGGNEMAGVYEDSDRESGPKTPLEEEQAFKRVQIKGFWGMLVIMAVVMLILLVVGTIIGGIFLILRPFLIPLMIIALIYWLFKGSGRR